MNKSTKIAIGLRLFFAALVLFVGREVAPLPAMMVAAFIMSLPTFSFKQFHKTILGEGFTDDQKTELKDLLKGVADKNKELVKEELRTATEGLMKTDDLAKSLEAMGLKADTIKTLTEAVEKQGTELRQMLEEGKKGVQKSLDEMINEKAEQIKSIAQEERKAVKLIVDKTQVARASVSGNTAAQLIPGVGELPYMGMVLAPLFRQANIGAGLNGTIRYYDQAAITRNAGYIAEGAAYPESAITWIERTANAQKLSDSIPVTREAFNDVDFIKSEVDRLLNINLALKEDAALYSGTGVAPEIKGINVYAATAQAALGLGGPYVDTVDSANIYDLIAVLRVYIMTAKQSKYMPNAVLMNPVDILRYKLAKATDGHYILPPFITNNGQLVDSIRVIESNQVTANTLTIGDFRYGTIYNASALSIEMGWINDQFVKDAMTIKASKRHLLLVRNVDVDAFAKITDITAALALLETP